MRSSTKQKEVKTNMAPAVTIIRFEFQHSRINTPILQESL